jgi:PPP family 3-phenylpropionic acid transporter
MRRVAPLSVFWFLYFGGLGIFFPYYALYLHEDAGLDGTQVGIVLSVLPLIGIVAQPFWGHVADRSGARSRVLVVVTAAAAVGYAALTLARGFTGFIVLTAVLAVFATAVIPVSLSVTFAALRGAGPHAFGLVRVWGTIGYLAGVAGYPFALHRFAPAPGGGEPGLQSMFLASAVLVGAAALLGPWLPRHGGVALRASRGHWRALLREPPMLRLLCFTLGGYVFLQGPTQIFPIFVRAHGGDVATVGRMWVVMLLLEIPLVTLSGAGLQRLGARGLLAAGVLAGGLRWTVCALSDDLTVIYVVQLLHGVTVTGLLLGGPLYLELIVPESLRSTGQGLLAMVSVGVGGIVSNAAAGWLLEHGGANAPFLIGGLGAIALGCAVTYILPPPVSPRSLASHGLPGSAAAGTLGESRLEGGDAALPFGDMR